MHEGNRSILVRGVQRGKHERVQSPLKKDFFQGEEEKIGTATWRIVEKRIEKISFL